VHRIVATSLALVALAAGGATIAQAESGGASAPPTKAEAVAFAQAVNLQARDLPGAEKFEPPPYEVAQDEKEGAASWSRTLRCARPGIVTHRPLQVESSVLASFPRSQPRVSRQRRSLYVGWEVASSVRVMPTEAIAAAEVAAFASRPGHACFARGGRARHFGKRTFGAVTAMFIPLTSLVGSGAIGVHDLIRESFEGKHSFLHSDGAFFRVGRADMLFSVLGNPQFPAATEGRLLSLLYIRAEAHKL
jgi:hypothetical protein